MKLQTIYEASLIGGNLKKAIAFIDELVSDEESYLEDDEDADDELLYAYSDIASDVKNNAIKSFDDLEQIGNAVYQATGSGDTDLAHHVQMTLGELLDIATPT